MKTHTQNPRTPAIVAGRFHLEALLGEGGMGAVYRARDELLGRTVAVKLLRRGALADEDDVERFTREARAAARLKHPGIVTVYDFGVAPESGAYIVMELLEGVSLDAHLRAARRLPLAEVTALLADVCAAVDAAHAAGVLHRDLKPQNIFLERLPDGGVRAKVLDFGIAQVAEPAAARLTGEGVPIGTPHYMSPEQCEGDAATVRSDVYSLGCVAYELLVGGPPFRARNAYATMLQHVSAPPKPPSATRPDLPARVDADAAFAEGRRMPLKEAIRYALDRDWT